MKLVYSILADAAEVSAGNKLYLLGGDLDAIVAESVPVLHTKLALAIKLQAEISDIGHEHSIRIDVNGPSGFELVGVDIVLPKPAEPDAVTGKLGVYMFAVNFPPIVFPAFGEYKVNLVLDDAVLSSHPLTVVEGIV
jgi:hypothetical protein